MSYIQTELNSKRDSFAPKVRRTNSIDCDLGKEENRLDINNY